MGTSVTVHRIEKCRSCGGVNFTDVINLGRQYVIDFPEKVQSDALSAPLVVVRCGTCNLVQLAHSVDPDRLYKKFWYRSGISEQMREALSEIVRRACSCVRLEAGDLVLDIGANDGTLLEMYPNTVTTVGIDPASELIKEASEKGRADIAIADYFSKKKLETYGKYKVITAVAMFYDLENPKQFLEDCRDLLRPEGVIIIQMNYLGAMLQNRTVDNISHEHLTYFSATTFYQLVQSVGLDIQGVETNDVNGGSFRVYLTNGHSLDGMSVGRQAELHAGFLKLLREEERNGLATEKPYIDFQMDVIKMKASLRSYLLNIKKAGARLFLYGASTRGATLLQLLGLPEGTFEAAAERDPKKFGRYTAGTWVKIIEEAEARRDATHFFVLPYHFWEQIKRREVLWLENGGTFILPLPVPMVVTKHGENKLLQRRLEPQTEVAQ